MALAFGTFDGNVLWCIDGNGEVMALGTFDSDGFWYIDGNGHGFCYI